MRIAILGATSQLARDLIVSLSSDEQQQLHLFARRPEDVQRWLVNSDLPEYAVDDLALFTRYSFDAVINFIGVGDPAKLAAMGNAIFDVTLRYDGLVLDYLRDNPDCRYLFLSSGAAYGSNFERPATRETEATVRINHLSSHEWYGVAKMHAECRHRACVDLPIIDIRIFNYFSRTQDVNARFLITDMLRAIRDGVILKTSSDFIVRDYLHPSDFSRLVEALLSAPPANAAVDCYSKAPIEKPDLLAAMQNSFGLRYELVASTGDINPTGRKPHYYSHNMLAGEFGYEPGLTSLDGVLTEARAILEECNQMIGEK